MITLHPHRNDISPITLAKYVGIKYQLQKCAGSSFCKRELSHSMHFWYDEVLLVDPVEASCLDFSGKTVVKVAFIPIRYMNFCFAVSKILERPKPATELDVLKAAIEYTRINCFDAKGRPLDIAEKLGFSSYSKFMEMLESKDEVFTP